MIENKPKVKKGDMVILRKAKNGQQNWENIVLEVTSGTTNTISGHLQVKSATGHPGGTTNLFYGNPGDDFCLADRKEQANHLKIKLVEMKKEMNTIKDEITHLEKYDSEEEFVADKINKLFKAKGVKAMAEILKELKSSNVL